MRMMKTKTWMVMMMMMLMDSASNYVDLGAMGGRRGDYLRCRSEEGVGRSIERHAGCLHRAFDVQMVAKKLQ